MRILKSYTITSIADTFVPSTITMLLVLICAFAALGLLIFMDPFWILQTKIPGIWPLRKGCPHPTHLIKPTENIYNCNCFSCTRPIREPQLLVCRMCGTGFHMISPLCGFSPASKPKPKL